MIPIIKAADVQIQSLRSRRDAGNKNVTDTVADILRDVRNRGDDAVFAYTKRFDGADLSELTVTPEETAAALREQDSEWMAILQNAAARIRRFHEQQARQGFRLEAPENGTVIGQRVTPLERVGLYVPGGTAAYPSTVLMDAIPAKIAGVKELAIATPPGPDGKVSPAILCAAYVAGVDKIYKMGGAQAIAALAFGTKSVKRVDKIVGPGNAYVAEAKRQVFGIVDIDMIAGPSEILIVADGKSDPRHAAADLLSQAEHDRNACAVLITDDPSFAAEVQKETERQLQTLPRAQIARASIDANGKIIVAESLEEAVALANEVAPEHLELMTDDPFSLFGQVRHAGSVFLGRNCPEALGDYYAGPNHTLPTSGTARFSSPLSVDDFVKKTQFTYYTREALRQDAASIARFARTEGLEAHARSVLVRTEEPV